MNNDDQESDDRIIEAARQLATDIRPGRDLWPDIEAAITTPKRSRWTPVFAQAAAVVLLVGASSSLTYLAVRDQQMQVVQPAQVVTTEMMFRQMSFGGNYQLGAGFQDARGNLTSKLNQQLDRLSPELRAEVEKNMQLIHDAISEINLALEKEPNNVLLQELLLSTYREELNLMHRIGDLTNNIMKRNDI